MHMNIDQPRSNKTIRRLNHPIRFAKILPHSGNLPIANQQIPTPLHLLRRIKNRPVLNQY